MSLGRQEVLVWNDDAEDLLHHKTVTALKWIKNMEAERLAVQAGICGQVTTAVMTLPVTSIVALKSTHGTTLGLGRKSPSFMNP